MLGQGDADCHAHISALFRMKSVLYSRKQRSAKVANKYAGAIPSNVRTGVSRP